MNIYINPTKEDWQKLCERPVAAALMLEEIVASILKEVELNGDLALKNYTGKFDGVELSDLKVS